MPERIFDGSELRDRRVLRRMSQTELGDILHVGTNAVSRWETGRAVPPPERLPGIAEAVGADLDGLFPRSEPPNLADLRCDAGMTQADTTKHTGTRSPMAVRAAERGKRPLPEELHAALSEAYGVTVQQLLAAQKRSFGHIVPTTPGEGESPFLQASSVVAKLTHLREEVFAGTLPPDAHLVAEGNRRFGRPVLTEDLIEGLRRGTARTGITDDVLDALALALDVPVAFFRTPDPQVERLVLSARAVRSHRFTVAAARGGEREIPEDVRAELRDFINSTFTEILGPDTEQPR